MTIRLLPPGENRVTLDLASLGLPEVPLVGIHHQAQATRGLLAHIHEGAMEICYLVRGERTYHAGGEDYTFRGNELFVTFPDEPHGSGRHVHGKGLLYWLQLRLPKTRRTFLGLAPAEAAALTRALRSLPQRLFRGERRLQGLFETIMRLCQAEAHDLTRLEVAAHLVEWLLIVIRCARLGAERRRTGDIQAILERIDAQPAAVLRLEELAAAARLSTSRFKAKFKEQVGMPPGEYILRRKIEHARALLARGAPSVTEIAYELGFSSSQYFATVFKRFTDLRPRDLRRRSSE